MPSQIGNYYSTIKNWGSGSSFLRYSGTSPLGHLSSGDTEFGLGKMFILIFHSNSTTIKGTPLVYSQFTCPGPEGVPWMEVPLYKQVKTKYRGWGEEGGGGGGVWRAFLLP